MSKMLMQYGNYAVGFLAAIGALVFASVMPAHAHEIISAAGVIAVLTFFFTDEDEPFIIRAMAMCAAAVCMVFAIVMPASAVQLISAAGTIAVLSLIFA